MEASLQAPGHTQPAASRYERRKYIDRVKEALTPLDRTHGALQESVVLWGVTGVGKRNIAIQAAREICADDGRFLLIVNARTFGTLISSFTQAYIAFTGQTLSRTEHFLLNFYQLRLNLSRRKSEWLMVVLDIDLISESYFDNLTFPPIFPTRGQIIFTNTINTRGSDANDLLSAVNPTRIYVPPLKAKDIRRYARSQCPELLHLPKGGSGLLETNHTTLLDLKMIAANMRLLGCSLKQYISYYSCRIRDRASATMYVLPLVFTPASIHREIFWDLLEERSRWASRLLAALAFLDPWAIPVVALEQLPMFKRTIADRLQPALELLHSLEIITFHDQHVSIQPALHIYFRSYLPKACLKTDWEALRLAWTVILRDSIARESSSVFDYWSLGIHAWAASAFLLVRNNPPRLESLMFLLGAAKLEIYYIIYRHTLLDDALKLCGPLLSRTIEFAAEMEEYYITKVRFARAENYLAADVRQADAELRLALPHLRRIEDNYLYWKMKESQWEIEARVLIAQDKSAQAETLLDHLFDRYAFSISHRARKRYYHLMAVALAEQDKTVAALQYSHEAMMYYAHRYKADGRPPRNRLAAEIVDTHIDLLIRMKKYRGALVYLIPTIEKMLITLPQRPPVILKYAKQALLCYSALRNLKDAEHLVIQILQANTDADCGIREDRSLVFANDLADDCMPPYISMLVHLSSLYFWHGRLIEAEGIMRYIIAVELQRVANDRPPLKNWFNDLMLFLYTRGNHVMLQRVARQLETLHNRSFPNEEIENILSTYSKTRELYQRALWAAEDQCYEYWWKDLLPEGTARSRFILAEGLWGRAHDRIRDGRDFVSDLDFGGIATAKKSKIMHLLGFDLVGLAFASNLHPQQRKMIKNSRGEEVEVYRGFWPHVDETPVRRRRIRGDDVDIVPTPSRRDSARSSQEVPRTHAIEDGREMTEMGQAMDADDATHDEVAVVQGAVKIVPLPKQDTIAQQHHKDGQSNGEGQRASPISLPRIETTQAHRAPKLRRRKEMVISILPGRIRPPIIVAPREPGETDCVLNVIDIWANNWLQRTLPEYWPWCYCRRHRTRSNSLDRIDLIGKRFLREECEENATAAARAKLVQKKITDSYILLPPEPSSRSRGCGPECPCIAANIQSAADWADYGLNLATWPSENLHQAPEPIGSRKWNTVATGRHPLRDPSSRNRFRSPRKPTPSLLPDAIFICLTRILASIEADPAAWDAAVTESREQHNHEPLAEALDVDESATQILLGSTWKFLQTELTPMVERRGENYCMKHALEVPDLTVTLAEDDWWLHGVKGRGRWFWRDAKDKEETDKLKALLDSAKLLNLNNLEEPSWESVWMVDVADDSGRSRKAWVKWRKRDQYTGEGEKWWVLTKRKELLTEYFERGAFGPSQRAKSEKALFENFCRRERLQEIQEEDEDGTDDQEDEPIDLVRVATEEADNTPESAPGPIERQLDQRGEEEDAVMAAFYHGCWARVATKPSSSHRPATLSSVERVLASHNMPPGT